jgi:LmbE family N-acetylglucosaminyl deacetylase
VSNHLERNCAFAIAAHPDDIEFGMAGTLLLLKRAGWETHYLNLSKGHCGSTEFNASQTRRIRRREAQAAAYLIGARWHPPLCDDLEILYELKTLRRLAAVIRDVNPGLVLTHSPQDYMEDHMNACRLAVTAAFARGMKNFRTIPRTRTVEAEVTLYHAMPHGLCDQLGQPVYPSIFVNTTSVHSAKRAALAAHQSQKAWLDVSQGMDSYLRVMDEMSLAVGKMSRRFKHAEGWRRHAHMGFCAADADPLRRALGLNCLTNKSRR